MHKTHIGRLRLIGIIEGISFLLLLGIAMPLKYFADMPHAVKVVGWAHGLLYIVFLMALVLAVVAVGLSLRWAAIAFVASLLPFGPFVIDKHLKQRDPEHPDNQRPDGDETPAGTAVEPQSSPEAAQPS